MSSQYLNNLAELNGISPANASKGSLFVTLEDASTICQELGGLALPLAELLPSELDDDAEESLDFWAIQGSCVPGKNSAIPAARRSLNGTTCVG